ncbi:MAG TPA: hypothetical protein VMF63_09370 [Opitutaceae bacterium]|nr:hypothetical protein [Opitutaceae bacterium]
MRIAAAILVLLIPLALRGAGEKKQPDPKHVWPVAATAAPASPAAVPFASYPDTGQLMNRSVQDLRATLAEPAAPRQSLDHFDLSPRVRLAMMSRPRWDQSVLGRASLHVPVFSLRW